LSQSETGSGVLPGTFMFGVVLEKSSGGGATGLFLSSLTVQCSSSGLGDYEFNTIW
jgi:hypothetical protein